jgi:hypothetical protein
MLAFTPLLPTCSSLTLSGEFGLSRLTAADSTKANKQDRIAATFILMMFKGKL